MKTPLLPSLIFLFFTVTSNAQDELSIIAKYLDQVRSNGFGDNELIDYRISNVYTTSHNQVKHVYIIQMVNGFEIKGSVTNFHIRDNQVLGMGDRLIRNAASKTNKAIAKITPAQAIGSAARHLGFTPTLNTILTGNGGNGNYLFQNDELSDEEIPVKLCYFPYSENELRLAYDLSIQPPGQTDWWDLTVDAVTGEILKKHNRVLYCSTGIFSGRDKPHFHECTSDLSRKGGQLTSSSPDSYNVYALPVESPHHGIRSLVVDPADPVASPFGWHDTNGVPGAEYTITRGNNVYAAEDANEDDIPGFSPDGGANLEFDFPINFFSSPSSYQSASITQLFYTTNMMHDIWYRYGFDEVAGNFQENNYGNGGVEGDQVRADAQDGFFIASFISGPDGTSPKLTMPLYPAQSSTKRLLFAHSPVSVSGVYVGASATFGPSDFAPITAEVAIAKDTSGELFDACTTIMNPSEVTGKIVIVEDDGCAYPVKVDNAQMAGAVGVIVHNNSPAPPFILTGSGAGITIPPVKISLFDGDDILHELQNNETVVATIAEVIDPSQVDGAFDNGLVAHEYAHGISTRLTGGPSLNSCLNNDEQMGEGWSDWFALVMMIGPGSEGTDLRPFSTFAHDDLPNETGVRNAPYTTDMTVNPYTYGDTNNGSDVSQPHGIGFVWATMLWDLTWAFIDTYGFDSDLYSGTGGNNIAMQLIVDGLKLQACNPGFVDGRDAILMADQINNNGDNQCLIWQAFANRGLGASAEQGSSDDRFDQVEAFDLPVSCQATSVSPSPQSEPDVFTGIFLYPNPASEKLVIRFNERLERDLEINLFDIFGRALVSSSIASGTKEKEIMLPLLPVGVYFLELSDGLHNRAYKFTIGNP